MKIILRKRPDVLHIRLASFLWTRHPAADNPLPEIFVERLRGLDENWLPAATPGCEKVLLMGRSGRDSVWPVPCAPIALPARCQQAGATCYANRTKTGYEFVSPSVSAPQVFRLDRRRTWPQSAEPVVADALASLAWWNMSARQAGEPDAVIQSARRVGDLVIWQASTRFLVLAIDVGPEAELVTRVAQDLRGVLKVESGRIDGTRRGVHLGVPQ